MSENETSYCCFCDKSSLAKKWTESEVGCEDCGSHPAHKCPLCAESTDDIFNDFPYSAPVEASKDCRFAKLEE